MNVSKIYAVDFDGTLCENKWPEIGEPIQPMIDYCIELREQGHKLILWTCRTREQTEAAVKWCNERGLFFHAVNANLPDEIAKYNNDPRKVGADYFIDDKNLSVDEIIRQNTPLASRKINILGTDYSIIKQSIKDNEMFKDCDGYIDWTRREIYIRDYSIDKDDLEYKDCHIHMNKTLRHEIIHGFLHESGLWTNSGTITHNWAMNEEMVDWFAIQSPKIFKVYDELGIL